jgi:hypothetical protein
VSPSPATINTSRTRTGGGPACTAMPLVPMIPAPRHTVPLIESAHSPHAVSDRHCWLKFSPSRPHDADFLVALSAMTDPARYSLSAQLRPAIQLKISWYWSEDLSRSPPP